MAKAPTKRATKTKRTKAAPAEDLSLSPADNNLDRPQTENDESLSLSPREDLFEEPSRDRDEDEWRPGQRGEVKEAAQAPVDRDEPVRKPVEARRPVERPERP